MRVLVWMRGLVNWGVLSVILCTGRIFVVSVYETLFTLKHFQSKTNTSYSFTWRQCGVSTNTFTPKTLHVIVIISEYPREFHVTTIPCGRSWDALCAIPPKWVAANKKKQFVWTDNEVQLLLAVAHSFKIKHLVEGTRDYRQTQSSVFIKVSFSPFTRVFSSVLTCSVFEAST